MLARFEGFPEIQVIDLNAALGRGENNAIVELLASRARCRVGGGVRSTERARTLVDCGAHRVIVGTSAFTATGVNHTLLAAIALKSAASVSPSLDSKGGDRRQGWTGRSTSRPMVWRNSTPLRQFSAPRRRKA
jgi:phosphoribosylformimino-5-aminoimidazole carboxamide ribonucleotide (ProFAR) isomerase